ncbi:type II toxin-antitoxin system VapC family toxin [Leucobacter weissii]|uniref:Type II toxin-antitoxin system VapC family toxin n=1 Tax=Leucobacter weissii TaxID=1983706 RepID=A0A939S651_9MICO|nr:type II toxin-antitoxin system VapC family toxin [Leucobacter weissii]MBO1902004.1 type II toxin-antitoxin system VapC family toxin [Leucobacter weissii]
MRVFDASALLAFLFDEPGGSTVAAYLEDGCCCGAANWSEVAQKVALQGGVWREARALLLSFGLSIESVSAEDAETAAELWQRGSGLSLGDRLCLALGRRLDREIVTADTAWSGLPGILLIR